MSNNQAINSRKDIATYIRFFETNDCLGKVFGHKIISIDGVKCISEYQVDPLHFNPNGILHGGALYSVMDSAQGAFIHYILDEKFKYAATGTATIKYLAPVLSGKVTITTQLKEIQNRKHFINSVATDDSGKEVATLEEIWIATLNT